MPTHRQLTVLVKEWKEIQRAQGSCDHALALWSRRLALAYGHRAGFYRFHIDVLEVRENGTIARHWRMAEAVDLVRDKATWSALGWAGVRSLVKLPEAKRAEAEAALLRVNAAKGSVRPGVLRATLAEVAPEAVVPRPTAKDRADDRKAKSKVTPEGKKVAMPAPAAAAHALILGDAFLRLVRDGVLPLALVRAHLTTAELAALEAGANAKNKKKRKA